MLSLTGRGIVRSFVIRYHSQASHLRFQRRRLLRGISALLARYNLSFLGVLDLINWCSQFC